MNNNSDEVTPDVKSKFLGDAEFMKETLTNIGSIVSNMAQAVNRFILLGFYRHT